MAGCRSCGRHQKSATQWHPCRQHGLTCRQKREGDGLCRAGMFGIRTNEGTGPTACRQDSRKIAGPHPTRTANATRRYNKLSCSSDCSAGLLTPKTHGTMPSCIACPVTPLKTGHRRENKRRWAASRRAWRPVCVAGRQIAHEFL